MTRFSEYKILEGSYRRPFFGVDAGKPDANEQVTVTVHLRRLNYLDIDLLLSSRQFITRETLAQRYSASVPDIKAVLDFATHFGLTLSKIDKQKRLITLTGSVQAIEHAFKVELTNHKLLEKVYRTRIGSIWLPLELEGVVTAVFGLDNRPQAVPHFRHSQQAQDRSTKPQAFDGAQLATIYDFPPSQGDGQTIALIELGGGFLQSDIQTFFSALGLPAPTVKAVSVNGATNNPGQDNGADTEVALDIQVAGAAAPGSTIVVYFAPNTDQGFLQAVLTAIHDSDNKPDIMSISWGAAEVNWTGQMMSAMDEAFQSAVALGFSVFAAAGDDGSNDNVYDFQPHVDFPASSPSLTACGGTRLVVDNGQRQETVWNDFGNGATGGGISDFFDRPSYQATTAMPANLSGGKPGRGLPDVAATADPATGYATLVNGQWYTVGGTSAVGPLYAGLLARINQQLGRPGGLVNLSLYGAGITNGFNDIVSGGNSYDAVPGYTASPGWDAVTGWGTPGGLALLNLLSAQAANP